MKKFLSTLLVASMLSAGAVALAEDHPHHHGHPFPFFFPFYQQQVPQYPQQQEPDLNEEAGISTLRLHTTTSTTVRGH